MGYRELYTAANMADEEYNISDKGLSITPDKINFTVAPGAVAEGQFVVAGAQGTAVTGFLISDNGLTPGLLRMEMSVRGR